MKKKFISSVALAMAAVLTFGMTVSASGSPSPTTSVAVETVDMSTLKAPSNATSTIPVTLTTPSDLEAIVSESSNNVQTNGLKEQTGLEPEQVRMTLAAKPMDLAGTITAGTSIDVTVDADVKKGENLVCLHKQTGADSWEVLKAEAIADGKVTIYGITSFSPFALYRWSKKLDAAPTESTGSTESYQAFVYTYGVKNLKGDLQDNAQILKGIGEYNSLSGSEQVAANQLLKNLTGKTYPELYAAAGGQAANVSTTPTSPKTGASLPLAGVLAVLCMAGAAVCTTKARSTK